MKRGLFFLGIGLLMLAFVAGASEIAAQGISGELRFYMPIAEVWQILSPETLEQSRDWGVGIVGSLWRAVELMMLLPGWFLFGLPGFTMALLFREHDIMTDMDQEESVFFYDELAKQVHDEGMDSAEQGDDVMPSSPETIEPPDEDLVDEHVEDGDDKPPAKD